MIDAESVKGIEIFRDSELPIYWIDDNFAEKTFSESLRMNRVPYGLEVGFGSEVSRLFLLEKGLWVAAEPDKSQYIAAKKHMHTIWDDVKVRLQYQNAFNFKAVALNIEVNPDDLVHPKTLVYRNFDYTSQSLPFPHRQQLLPGQRLVVAIDGTFSSFSDLDVYKEYLLEKGYRNPSFNQIYPALSEAVKKQKEQQYVFDFSLR